jgi:hypothetical protein
MGMRTWDFRDEGLHRYHVELEQGHWSGSRVVRLDGREVLRAKRLLEAGGELRFAEGGHLFNIVYQSDGSSWSYELVVDGQTVGVPGTVVHAPAEGPDIRVTVGHVYAPEDSARVPAGAAIQERRDFGARWFYWIAGLSLLNAVLYALSREWEVALGAGLGFILQGIAIELFGQRGSWLAHLPVIALFAWFGWQALRGRQWAFLAGGVIFALDAGLVLLVQDWIALGLHGFALFAIVGGWRAQRELDLTVAAPLSSAA